MRSLALLLLFSFALGSFAPGQQVVQIAQGAVLGGVNPGAGVAYYLGIPYAQAERWKAPKPPGRWAQPHDATRFGPACPQSVDFIASLSGVPPQSEDCLNLNIWTPLGRAPQGGWPVMVWVHGGAFTFGSGRDPLYDGSTLASSGVVVVTFNYRLGPLGWLALPALQAEDPLGSTGNYGLLDQQAALRWVQQNIQGFGGNPRNVTVFGESAGGMSVCALLASPASKGLFQKAIIQSGGCTYVRPLEDGFRFGLEYARERGCPGGDLACLRALPLEKMLPKVEQNLQQALTNVQAQPFYDSPWKPHLDGAELDLLPLEALRQGRAAGIALIAGGNAEEVWSEYLFAPGDWDGFKMRIKAELGAATAEQAMRVYKTYPDPREAWAYFQSERTLLCPSLEAARVQSRYAPVYSYVLTFRAPGLSFLRSFHALDLPLLFGNLNVGAFAVGFMGGWAEPGREMGARMREYWVSFAKTGTPQGRMGWPMASSGQLLNLSLPLEAEANPYTERCQVFRTTPDPRAEVAEESAAAPNSGD
ncbi:MAG TPA: carboxylesterase family protein [Meiothermus sp.]|nr:carboxylesterase family protein [Meiothermus sp.]